MKGYLRVSEILARIKPFTGIDEEVLKAKAEIGTNVHHAIIADATGDFPLFDTERAAAYFQSYQLWKKREKPEFLMQVPRLYCNELRITGEIDALIKGNMQYPILMDWKCSAQIDEEIWGMQAHFYWYLLRQNNIEVSNVMRWVQLRHQKSYEMGPLGERVVRYSPLAPKITEFFFDPVVLSRCIDEANRAWEEKRDCLVLDW